MHKIMFNSKITCPCLHLLFMQSVHLILQFQINQQSLNHFRVFECIFNDTVDFENQPERLWTSWKFGQKRFRKLNDLQIYWCSLEGETSFNILRAKKKEVPVGQAAVAVLHVMGLDQVKIGFFAHLFSRSSKKFRKPERGTWKGLLVLQAKITIKYFNLTDVKKCKNRQTHKPNKVENKPEQGI